MKRVVVIGAGVGGLTTAALLAKDGFDVTVLEAHVYPGGCAGTFYHKGYRFDAGATVAGGFQPGGPHDIVGKLLNIQWPIHRTDPSWVVQLPDRTIVRWGDEALWQDERNRILPELKSFWTIQEHVADVVWQFAARSPEWPLASLADLIRLIGKVPSAMLPLTPLMPLSVRHVLDMLRVPSGMARTFIDAQLLISAQTTADHANALYGCVSIDLPRVGTYHVQGGIGGIARTLVEALKTQCGAIHFRREVTRIERLSNGLFRLHTNKGECYEAEIVIGNLTPWSLNCLLGEQSPDSLRREIAVREPTWGAFTLYIGFPAELAPQQADHYQIIHDPGQPLGEGNSIFMSISDADDLSRAPQGYRAMTISTHTHIDKWWQFKAADPEAYQQRIEVYRDKLLASAESVIPGLRDRAALILPGTPDAFQRFTRRFHGMVGGFPQTSLFAARGPQTGIPNLWLVGDSIFPGQSTAGVTAGALRVAAEVKRSGQA